MKYLSTCVLFLLLLPAVVLGNALDAAWSRGNQAFADGALEEAATAYRDALQIGQTANLHYNLANTYSALAQWGPAILHYRKALAMDPLHPDARANLHLAQREAGIEPPPPSIWQRWAESLPLTLWIIAASVAFWLLVAIWLFGRQFDAPRTRLLLSLMAVVVLLASGPALYGYHVMGSAGVVVADRAALRVAPVPESPTTLELKAGSLAQIRRQTNGYYLVQLPTGEEGYLAPEELEFVWESTEGKPVSASGG